MANLRKPRKLAFVIPEYNPTTPTHFNYLYDLLGNISKEFDLFLIAEKGSGRPDFIKENKFYLQKFRSGPMRILENIFLLFQLRLKGYKDFYIHYSFLSAFNASLIVKSLGGRTFYWNCGLPWKYKRSLIRETFELLTYKFITYLVTGTEGLKKEYAKNYQFPLDRIKVLPNWIDVRKVESQKSKVKSGELREKLNIPVGTKVLLFAHRLSRRKGAHYLSEIVKLLKAEPIVLLIAGDGPEREALNLQLKTHNLQQKVRMLGWVPQNEVLKYFSVADIFLLPSEEEGFPHVLLEAMAMGVPFVAFDIGGVKEITPPEFLEYIIAPVDVKNFSDKIKEILRYNGERIEKMSAIERDWVKQFDLLITIDKFRDIILN